MDENDPPPPPSKGDAHGRDTDSDDSDDVWEVKPEPSKALMPSMPRARQRDDNSDSEDVWEVPPKPGSDDDRGDSDGGPWQVQRKERLRLEAIAAKKSKDNQLSKKRNEKDPAADKKPDHTLSSKNKRAELGPSRPSVPSRQSKAAAPLSIVARNFRPKNEDNSESEDDAFEEKRPQPLSPPVQSRPSASVPREAKTVTGGPAGNKKKPASSQKQPGPPKEKRAKHAPLSPSAPASPLRPPRQPADDKTKKRGPQTRGPATVDAKVKRGCAEKKKATSSISPATVTQSHALGAQAASTGQDVENAKTVSHDSEIVDDNNDVLAEEEGGDGVVAKNGRTKGERAKTTDFGYIKMKANQAVAEIGPSSNRRKQPSVNEPSKEKARALTKAEKLAKRTAKRKAQRKARKKARKNKAWKKVKSKVPKKKKKLQNDVVQHRNDCKMAVISAFNETSKDYTKIVNEASMFARLDSTRRNEEKKALSKFDENYFYACCSVAVERTGSRESRREKDEELDKSLALYYSLQPQETKFKEAYHQQDVPIAHYRKVKLQNNSHLISQARDAQIVMLTNHLVANTPKWIKRYLQVKFGIPKKKCGKFLYEVNQADKAKRDAARTKWRTSFRKNEREVDDFYSRFLLFNPFFEKHVKDNLGHFVGLGFEILKFFEEQQKKVVAEKPEHEQPNGSAAKRDAKSLKGLKLFDVLPSPNNKIPIHFTIDRAALGDVLSRLEEKHRRTILVEAINRLNQAKGALERETTEAQNGCLPDAEVKVQGLAQKQVEVTKLINAINERLKKNADVHHRSLSRDKLFQETLWEIVFNTAAVERNGQNSYKFDYAVQTDGVSVSMRMARPQSEEDLAVEAMPDLKNKTKQKKKQKIMNANERALSDAREAFARPAEPEHPNVRLVGLDPGKTFMGTAFCELSTEKQDRAKNFVQVSTKEHRHRAKFKQFNDWNKRQEENVKHLKRIGTDEMTSTKTADLKKLMDAIRYRVKWGDFLLHLGSQGGYRNWRFKKYRYGEKSISKAAKDLTFGSKDPKQTIVGFGDWSQPQGFKGLPSAPLKKLARKMVKDRRAIVVSIDEYKTSKLCSVCPEHTELVHARFKSHETRRNRTRRERREQGQTEAERALEQEEEEEEPGQAVGGAGQVQRQLRKCHQVVHCPKCKICWQRDFNAARNIHLLLQSKLQDGTRPNAFERKNKVNQVAQPTNSLGDDKFAPAGAL